MAKTSRAPESIPGALVDEKKERYSVNVQGRMLTVKKLRSYPALPVKRKRGAVQEFSRESRLRLLKLVAKVDWKATGKCLFITLTYPDWCAHSALHERTQHRSQFLRDLELYLGRQVACLWRCEWKKRRSGHFKGWMLPHFHLIIFRCQYIPHQVVNNIWKGAIKAPKYVRTECKAANTGEHGARYAAKYVAKRSDHRSLVSTAYLNTMGRPWGTTRVSLIPLCAADEFILTSKSQVGRAMSIAAQLLGRHYCGAFTVFSDIAAEMARHVLGRKAKRA